MVVGDPRKKSNDPTPLWMEGIHINMPLGRASVMPRGTHSLVIINVPTGNGPPIAIPAAEQWCVRPYSVYTAFPMAKVRLAV